MGQPVARVLERLDLLDQLGAVVGEAVEQLGESREMSMAFADACVNRSKNSRRWGVKLKRMVRAASYHVGGELAADA